MSRLQPETILSRQRIALNYALGEAIGGALTNRNVVEVMANPDGSIWVDEVGKRGCQMMEGAQLSAHDANTILRLLADHAGVIVNADTPRVSATLPQTGERFQGVFPPVVAQASFAIRKPPTLIYTLAHYVENGIMAAPLAATLQGALRDRLNILVIGGTGSGKTTLTNALLAEPAIINDRIVIIEDTKELQCIAKNKFSMLTKTIEPAVTMRDLARDTMRLRPDRVIVGEVRDGSILEMLKIWNTGHPGGIATLHANNPTEALYRIEDLVGEVMERIPVRQIAMTINLIVQIRRSSKISSGRIVDQLVKVDGHRNGAYVLTDFSTKEGLVNVA